MFVLGILFSLLVTPGIPAPRLSEGDIMQQMDYYWPEKSFLIEVEGSKEGRQYRGGADYSAGLAKYIKKITKKYDLELTEAELEFLTAHDQKLSMGWDFKTMSVADAIRLGRKVFPVWERIQKNNPKDAKRIERTLSSKHDMDISKLITLYTTFKNFI